MGCSDSKDASTSSKPHTTVVFSAIPAPPQRASLSDPAAVSPLTQLRRRAAVRPLRSEASRLWATCSTQESSSSPDLDGSGSRRLSASRPPRGPPTKGTAVTYPHVDSAGVTHHSVESLNASYFTRGRVARHE